MQKLKVKVGLLFTTILLGFMLTFSVGSLTIVSMNESENSQSVEKTPEQSTLPDPIIYYRFENFSDSMGNGNDAEPIGNTYLIADGLDGKGLYVQEAENKLQITIPDGLLNLTVFTVQFWFRQDSGIGENQYLIQKGNYLAQSTFTVFRYPWNEYNTASVIAGHGSASGQWQQVSNPNNLTFGKWHLVTYVKDENWHGYWIDGTPIYSNSISEPVYNSSDPIQIGVDSIGLYFDELKIWNYAVDEFDIEEYYKQYHPIASFYSDKISVTLGEQVDFFDTSEGGYQPYSYFWDFDDGIISYEKNPSHVFTMTGKTAFQVSLLITDALGNQSEYTESIYITNSIVYFELFSQTGQFAPDGRVNLFWTEAENAESYQILENENIIATRSPNDRNFSIVKPIPDTYYYKVRAIRQYETRDSNELFITTDVQVGAFSLWTYEADNPDRDSKFTLVWGESLNAEIFEVYEGERLIQTLSPTVRELVINVNRSGFYEYHVRAKNFKSSFESNRVNVNVDLFSNSSVDQENNTDLLKFLQENGWIIATGTAGAMALAVILKILKGRKGKIKINLPKGSLGASGGSSDDFFDSEF